MGSDGAGFVVAMCVLGSLMLIGGCFMGMDIQKDGMQRDAVKAGAAEWVANENGAAEFRWKNIEKEPDAQ